MASLPKRKWLLLFNCQAAGLARCLTLLSNEVEVEFFEPPAFAAEADAILNRISSYDQIIIAPNVEASLNLELGNLGNLLRFPTFNFAGYHPDHCNLIANGSWSGGPLAGNHSALAYGAYSCGLSVEATISLYREEMFAALGYFDHWPCARDALIQRYRDYGFDIAPALIEWSRERGGFTYVPSHPKMMCLKSLAEVLLRQAGLGVTPTDVLPHDNMANGVIFPIYPFVGPRLGIIGSFQFKAPGHYRHMDLSEFIDKSFAFYKSCDRIEVPSPWKPLLSRVTSVLASEQS